ncbi:nuclear transport factor 2 family protein [Roseomonas xinghualingensis]|uniref:nuclear transport factor 2 family protein n=1 Tax=Roseomonas xinghualingensis TaxID=2986475 RepID=UPI0021F11227|nr:nuclear transport factor 2 family protein [Roseomonas sp. SXEYE001]MCV4207602.1 nuclear transport factor 2 family protein [Roseomonas sp. SXEYE001]
MQDDIRALEARRYAAMEAGDVTALGGLLSDRLIYSHSDGSQDSKASYLATLSDGTLRYKKVWFETKAVLEAGSDSAVALGSMGADINRHGADKTIGSLTCAVWAKEGGAWKLLAYQPTALPKK